MFIEQPKPVGLLIIMPLDLKKTNELKPGLGYVQFRVPENRTRGQKSKKTRPGTTRKSKSVLEPDPEPPENISQF